MHDEISSGHVVAIAGIGVPSMVLTGFLSDLDVFSLPIWLLISVVSGGLGMMWAHTPRISALFGGLVAGACVPISLGVYVYFRLKYGDSFLKIELMLVGALGALPGLGIYKLINRIFGLDP